MSTILLYGAYGYSGRKIVELAEERDISLILAGRNRFKMHAHFENSDFEQRIFSLDQHDELVKQLEDIDVVLHAAGPFEQTAMPMAEACLKTATHYIDITGEISVFEALKKLNRKAKRDGIMILPGAGFDVVPTDMVAGRLSEELPDATDLELAFAPINGKISHGTLTTMIQQLGQPGASRVDGNIVNEPVGRHGKWIDFKEKERFAMTIPWGDVSTAYWSTEIPNIRVFTAVHPGFYKLMKAQFLINPLLKTDLVKNMLQKWTDKHIDGPDEETIKNAYTLVKGTVRNKLGETKTLILRCPESYLFTAESSLAIALKAANGDFQTGYQTPSTAYDFYLLTEIDGVEVLQPES